MTLLAISMVRIDIRATRLIEQPENYGPLDPVVKTALHAPNRTFVLSFRYPFGSGLQRRCLVLSRWAHGAKLHLQKVSGLSTTQVLSYILCKGTPQAHPLTFRSRTDDVLR